MTLTDLPYSFVRRLHLGFSALALIAGINTANAQTTVIQYNGALHLNGSPFTGTAEFAFTLWDAVAAGNQLAASSPASVIVGVTNGVFATALDFGANAFSGPDRWLQIQVRTNIAPFSLLSPRQPITAVPYAIRAAVAYATELPSGNYSNAVNFSSAGNLFAGNGFALTGLNAGNLASGTVADARITSTVARTNQVWLLGGNSGINTNSHFIGTTDQRPLEFRVNNQRALRLEPGGDSHDPDVANDGAPNVIAGSRFNFVSNGITGATISGGGAVNFGGASYSNRVLYHYGTIGGGLGNEARNHGSTVGGGSVNTSSGYNSTVGGGFDNLASSTSSTVGGGSENTASGTVSVVAGGAENHADEVASTIGGGEYNAANGWWGTVGGGLTNIVNGHAATVAGGRGNRANGESSVVAGGSGNRAEGTESAIGGGERNRAEGSASTVAGGYINRASNSWSTVGGGFTNRALALGSTVGGGVDNSATGQYATIPGGFDNSAHGQYSLAAGFRSWASHRGSFVWSDNNPARNGSYFASTAEDQFCINANGGVQLSAYTSLYFGGDGRQMLNLYRDSDDYGIGVQSSTLYFRSNDRFSWFRFGAHSDTENSPGAGGSVLMTLTSGGLTVNGAFVNASDRDKKENFQPVNSAEVLARVIALPLSRWTYRDDEERSRHLGPMAQDFHAAFGLGADNKHIATVDADGVALAAIQGLNAKVDQAAAAESARVRALEETNATLEQRLAELERLVSKLTAP